MQVKERLAELLKTLNLKQYQFAERIGVQPASVSEWLNKKNSNPTVESLVRISKSFNVNINWLLTGTGDIFIVPAPAHESQGKSRLSTFIPSTDTPGRQLGKIVEQLAAERIALRNHDSVRIPVVGDIAAGKPIEIDTIEPLEYLVLDKSIIHFPEDYLCFRIWGDSMTPEVRHGDIVLISKRYDWEHLDQQIIAVNINGEITLKVIHTDFINRQSILYPINNRRHKSIVLNEDTLDRVEIIGIIVLSVHKYI